MDNSTSDGFQFDNEGIYILSTSKSYEIERHSGMDDHLKRERDWKLAQWEDQRKDREQFHKHAMRVLHFFFILIPLTFTLIVFIFKNEDTRLILLLLF